MKSREADGSDKIAAFERGMSDDQVHMAFETPGVFAYIIDDTYLTAYAINEGMLYEMLRHKLYAGNGTNADVQDFLESEARMFDCKNVASFGD